MATDSGLSRDTPSPGLVPSYEPKLMYQFDHRWATFEDGSTRDLSVAEKDSPTVSVRTRWWAPLREVDERIGDR